MKLVVLAHKPPPLHGQSYMVELMLEGFGGDRRRMRGGPAPPPGEIECYHVNARLSKDLEDVGGVRFGKLLLLLWHCLQAVWCRFRYGATILYYVPAPGKRAALYRDWLVMALCRPFFKQTVLHWHATSLSKWLETGTSIRTRLITYRLMGQADLSIVLSQHARAISEKLWPRRIEVVANGVPDPCPEFKTSPLPHRRARAAARKKLLAGLPLTERESADAGAEPHIIRTLFLAHCTREKGLFDAVEATFLANAKLRAERCPVSFRLSVAGTFPNSTEREQFERLCRTQSEHGTIQYAGFLKGSEKTRAMLDADLLCFPSHWESFGLVLVEAMAFGLPSVSTQGGAVSEVMPTGYPGLARVRDPEQLASAMLTVAAYEDFPLLREHFLTNFTVRNHISRLAAALGHLNHGTR